MTGMARLHVYVFVPLRRIDFWFAEWIHLVSHLSFKKSLSHKYSKAVLPFAKVLISRIGSALAEQHEGMEEDEED